MTEMELDKFCDEHPLCDCECMHCPAFEKYYKSTLND